MIWHLLVRLEKYCYKKGCLSQSEYDSCWWFDRYDDIHDVVMDRRLLIDVLSETLYYSAKLKIFRLGT